MKTSNQNCRQYVERQEPFKANNLFAERHGNTYTVWSYGYHWPLFVCKGGQWYETNGKYSTTTSKHQSQARPENVGIISLPPADMKQFN